jgi:hypothetical protein
MYSQSINVHLGCFFPLVLISNAAINIDVQMSLQGADLKSVGNILRGGIAGSYGNSL